MRSAGLVAPRSLIRVSLSYAMGVIQYILPQCHTYSAPEKERILAASKIAITIPHTLLERVNQWSEKLAQSRSQFIAEQMEKRLQELEEEEVLRAYNQAYEDEQTLADNRALAEELLPSAPQADEDEAW